MHLPVYLMSGYTARVPSKNHILHAETRPATQQGSSKRIGRELCLTILCHPDADRVGERSFLDIRSGRTVSLSRSEPLFSQPGAKGGEPLAEPHISRTPLLISRLDHGVIKLDPATTRTPIEIDGVTIAEPRAFSRSEIDHGIVLKIGSRVVLLLHDSVPRDGSVADFGLIGDSAAMWRVRQEMAQLSDLEIPVLILGESGSGKELVAHAIHQSSQRREHPFLAINMGAIPSTLAAAELFGAVKGAYSGADRNRRGYFQRAHGGTLFLDEIGEAPPEVQVLLLRILETGRLQAVGDEQIQTVDVRIIAATDADLETATIEGNFKTPLLHRLAGYEILLPPLRERRDDIGRLFFYFLRHALREIGEEDRLRALEKGSAPWVPARLIAHLAAHDWPGNVRQLRNVVRQLVISSRGKERMEIIPRVERLLAQSVEASSDKAPNAGTPKRKPGPDLWRISEAELREVLKRHRFEIAPTASTLGVSRASVYKLMKRFRIPKASDLSKDSIEACFERCRGDLRRMAEDLQVSRRGLKLRMVETGLHAPRT